MMLWQAEQEQTALWQAGQGAKAEMMCGTFSHLQGRIALLSAQCHDDTIILGVMITPFRVPSIWHATRAFLISGRYKGASS